MNIQKKKFKCKILDGDLLIPEQEAGLGRRLAVRAPGGHTAEVAAGAALVHHAAGGDLRVHLRHALEAHEQGRKARVGSFSASELPKV